MCAHVNSVCRSASSVATCRVLVVGRRRQNSRPSVCFVSLGLLQFCHVRRSRRLDPAAPGCPERHRTTGDRNTEARPHQSSSQAAPVRQRVTFKLAVLVFKALHGLAPRYLADDCQLVTDAGCRHFRSFHRVGYLGTSTHQHPIRRPCVSTCRTICCRSSPP